MTTFTLKFHSLRMEEYSQFNWSEIRHFCSPVVYVTSGLLELETGEKLSSNRNETSISASLYFYLTPTEPVEGIPAESQMMYFEEIEDRYGSTIGPFITINIIASRSRFDELVTNVRHGLVPENISIKLAEDEKFWRSVDPTSKWSRKIWQNEIDNALGCAAIPVENYAFSYLIKKAGPGT